ncbi:MAG: type II secretion system protein [bacterium]|nr:type II secretion system protein [bacterium]
MRTEPGHHETKRRPVTPSPRGARLSVLRPAFTLTELIVSIGVLSLMMSMAGVVFHLTVKSTGEARAVTTVAQRLRDLETTLREDLSAVHPEQSILVIVPAKINAFWTAAGRDGAIAGVSGVLDPSLPYPHPVDPERESLVAGARVIDPPRADRLMFVTTRLSTSYVDPTISSGLAVVTYGHCIQGEWETLTPPPAPPVWTWRPQYGETVGTRPIRFDSAMLLAEVPQTGAGFVFPTPAEDWHLARRSVLLVEYAGGKPPPAQFDPVGPGLSPAVASNLDDASGYSASSKNLFALVEGRQDVVAYPSDGSGSFNYVDDLLYNPMHFPNYSNNDFMVEDVPQWYARSELDPTPPAPIAERLGHYLLPHCAYFKVEFALDLPELRGTGEVLWIDPADLVVDWNDAGLSPAKWSPTRQCFERLLAAVFPPGGVGGILGDYALNDPTNPARIAHARLTRLLNQDLHPGDATFGVRVAADPATATDEPMARWYTADIYGESPDPLYPAALRITVDVYDEEHRFERPTRHVMVFSIGS